MSAARLLRAGTLAVLLVAPVSGAATPAPDALWADADTAQEYQPRVWPSALGSLLFLAVLSTAAYLLMTRMKTSPRPAGDALLRELGSLHLSNGQRLTVVRFRDKVLLLSAAGQSATLLCETPAKDWPESALPEPPPPDPWEFVRKACAWLTRTRAPR
jgi:flagellar biogenesis protein FliO